jgi:hypothetical protein
LRIRILIFIYPGSWIQETAATVATAAPSFKIPAQYIFRILYSSSFFIMTFKNDVLG